MGVPKQKWTAEEEAALRAGVEKYGPGKWRAIQKDAKFAPCLVSRSNVDLKDKWRNMSVSGKGLGSRDKATKILASKMKQIGATHMNAMLGSETKGASILSTTSTTKEKKQLGSRYDNLILEAILSSKDPNGCNKNQIASYIEDHHPVPSNFRRLLTPKLKSLYLQGKLMKMRQNYTICEGVVFPLEEKAGKYRSRKQDVEAKLHNMDSKWQESEGKQIPRSARDSFKRNRDSGLIKLRVDVDASRFKTMTSIEAASLAAQAVAEAEAAAAAAEEAARAAEVAEAEWEAAEAAAVAAAALAAKSPRKFNKLLAVREGVAVPV